MRKVKQGCPDNAEERGKREVIMRGGKKWTPRCSKLPKRGEMTQDAVRGGDCADWGAKKSR